MLKPVNVLVDFIRGLDLVEQPAVCPRVPFQHVQRRQESVLLEDRLKKYRSFPPSVAEGDRLSVPVPALNQHPAGKKLPGVKLDLVARFDDGLVE